MGEQLSIEHRIMQAEHRWPGLQFKRKDRHEASAPCPFCPLADDDGFLIFDDGGYWCRQCGVQGWIDDDKPRTLTKEEQLERRLKEIERRQQEHEERLTRLEKMARCTDHLRYHNALTEEALEYWFGEGVIEQSIEKYLLGWCARCPTDRQHRASYTIPIVNHGRLENIRHRLAGTDSDKYRPHMAGLGLQLFNADFLDDELREIIIVEGEKKSIILSQSGFPNVGITGKRAFRREWLQRFDNLATVYVALDPDASASAHKLAALFGGRGRVVEMPCKVDDAIVKYGASSFNVESFLGMARPVGRTQ